MAARKRGPKSPQTISNQETSQPLPSPSSSLSTQDPLIEPSKLPQILSVSAIFFSGFFYLLFYHYEIESELKRSIVFNFFFSIFGFVFTIILIPVATKYLLRRNLFGYDINKKGTPQGAIKVPESLGIVVGIVFLVFTILFQYCNFTSDSKWLVQYNAGLASICFMTLLGFVDDVLDVPWRVKLLLPSIATLPLIMAYAGGTTIIIPKPLIPFVGLPDLDLGKMYHLYMFLLAVFCTNSINIHAGLNGLEAGQTAVISCAVLIHNIMQIGSSTDSEYKQTHAFSIYLIQPLLTTTLALLSFNWYPSSVFVGDTFTYFAGMALAVAGTLGHFSETLMIFFAPQILNFLTSVPQLFGFIDCPRHRLPRFDPQTGLLTGTKDGTLVNIFLRCFGRCSEKSLCLRLLAFQALCCIICFILRYILTGWYK
ncbi:Udp-n-acetylglucosamine--dolichyl-phosphate n-acetylglucosaminephosphotransferase [Thalictrum thalictroides]|uniref:UDP-N-acetylglucosamine--dolichyl-phosphate N-acetylglucosaminephosphotransferase n=1 Tax=Thalictrum thalictroides TaxID=46969 RepID=A0A7J6VDJ7_THATH|nr:Udp-n-acetylglucosamine--dolichyl-phosphate n-acetylglucosaminephosphotransferase [Thalictrum thalictroides]